jgi:hypothetical protein
MKDILLIFLFCAALVTAVSNDREPERVFTYNSAFQPPFFLTPQGNDKDASAKTIKRRFLWQDPAKQGRETVFIIPEPALKKEIKRFGTPHSFENPYFLEKRGFKIIGRRSYVHNNKIRERFTSIVDYKQIFQRNLAHFSSLTQTLTDSAALPPGQDPLYSFLSFVQHITYRLPPKRYKGLFINSFFIPLVLLYEQYGDCDSKSLLLAVFLSTTKTALTPGSQGEKTAMVLIRGNGLAHAVLAVKRKPLPGMTWLNDIKKGSFILVETTKPGWAPGFIHRRITDAIKAGLFYVVELN